MAQVLFHPLKHHIPIVQGAYGGICCFFQYIHVDISTCKTLSNTFKAGTH